MDPPPEQRYRPVQRSGQQIGDRFLIDGGMLNNMPVDVVKEMGADYVICVDLHHFKKARPDTDQTIPEMLSTMLTMMNGEKYQSGRAASDIIIEPNTSAYGVLDFDEVSVDALVDSGRVAANRVFPQLRSLADHLKEFPAGESVRPPKAVNLNRDSVLVSQIEISGTRLNAASSGDFIEKGVPVLVSGTEGDHCVIRRKA